MGYKGENVPGKFPESGAIFMSNSGTKNECLDRKLFGLPYNMSDFVLSVKKGMTLFLFEFEERLLYGVFRAISDGEIDIQPGAYETFGKKFPAQVRFTTVWNCIPLAEHEFHEAIKDNYYSGKKFNFGLNQDQVDNLMELFRFKKVSKNPERNFLRYGDKPEEGQARFGDLRKTIRDRLTVVSKENGDITRFGDLRKTIRDRLRVVSKEDGDITSNEKIVEVNKLSCDSFKKNRMREDDDITRFGDLRKTIRDRLRVVSKEDGNITSNEKIVEVNKLSCDSFKKDDDDLGAWKKLLGNHLPVSLVGLKRKADVGLHHMADLNNGHGMNNNLREIRGSANQDNSSMMEKSETENDTGDGYIPLFTETLEEQYDKIDVDSDDAMLQLNPSYSASGSVQYFEENQVSKTFTREGSVNPIFPKFISMGSTQVGTDENFTKGHESHAFGSSIIPFAAYNDSYREEPISKSLKKAAEPSDALKTLSSDTDLCVHEEDSHHDDRMLYQTREDNRAGAFARLTFDLRHEPEPEPETNEKHGLNESVDKVMQMLENVVSNAINKTNNINSVIKQDDISPASEILDEELPQCATELAADLAEESIDQELVGEEIEVVDFKRRKRGNKDETECLGGAARDSSCKRRELVRHDFVENELTGDGVSATLHL